MLSMTGCEGKKRLTFQQQALWCAAAAVAYAAVAAAGSAQIVAEAIGKPLLSPLLHINSNAALLEQKIQHKSSIHLKSSVGI